MKRFDLPLLVLLAASLIGNVFLAYQHLRLRGSLKVAPERARFATGTKVAMLAFSGGSYGDVVLRFPSPNKPVLLYVITSTCKWCSANTGMARALESTVQAGFQFITLCLDGNLDECREKTGSGPLYMPKAEVVALLKLGVVPQVIHVSAEGRVERVWTGVFRNETKKDLESYFGAPIQGSICGGSSDAENCEDLQTGS